MVLLNLPKNCKNWDEYNKKMEEVINENKGLPINEQLINMLEAAATIKVEKDESIQQKNPLIILMGLCGSGKSTISKELSKKTSYKVLNIGTIRNDLFREYFLMDIEINEREKWLIEDEVWTKLFKEAIDILWHDGVIIDTTGLNKRLNFLLIDARSFSNVLEIKLLCSDKELKNRLKKKKKSKDDFFPYSVEVGDNDKEFFNKLMQDQLKEKQCDIIVHTDKLNVKQCVDKIIIKLKEIQNNE
jgi:adenylate kinase family enzyme